MYLFHPQTLKPLILRFVILAVALSSSASLALPLVAKLNTSALLYATAGPLRCYPDNLWFSRVTVGETKTESGSLTNIGPLAITVLAMNQSGQGFSVNGLNLPLTLAPGQKVQFAVSFNPQVSGHVNGNLGFTSDASGSTLYLYVHGTGVATGILSANPSSSSFGNVQVGGSTTLSETLSNSGGSSITVSQATVTGAGFSLSGLSLPVVLNAGQSFTFGAVFAPTSSGSISGSISVVSNAANSTLPISLSAVGTAAGQFAVSPATLDFGSVSVGRSKNLTATLSAAGSSVTISSATTGTSEFVLSGLSFPLTIAAGQTAPLMVTFTPQASGAASDAASIASNASNPITLQSLTGSGGPVPPQHSVGLSWNSSTSLVIGYNVYRSTKKGGPYVRISGPLNVSDTYTDSVVQAGQTYYYVTSAVDPGGTEMGQRQSWGRVCKPMSIWMSY